MTATGMLKNGRTILEVQREPPCASTSGYYFAPKEMVMETEMLELRIARESVQDFHDNLMQAHAEAMDCLECEELLDKGISAYKWLSQAEATLREGAARGICPFTDKLRQALETLYYFWLDPCKYAEERIAAALEKGYNPDNLQEFRDCCERVRAWIEENEWRKRTRATSRRLANSEPW
ncbi:MAG: hypothetical protein K8T25_07265 [Planctomycetia bacterium]|nr:hypothetical protein [Planctomycetia bacterium]